MQSTIIQDFLNDCQSCCDQGLPASEIVLALAPRMEALLAHADEFLRDEHKQPDPNGYARHPVFICPEGGMSLFTMVWSPGQWTPIHDHGTWGVVGVLEGMLEERAFVRVDEAQGESGIELIRAGVVLLSQGSICTFTPSPEHIHRTGCDESRPTTLTLHLYGRVMTNFHVYDFDKGTRELIDVASSGSDLEGV